MNRKKALVVASYPAPYRVGVFKKLSEVYDLDVFFDTCKNENRNPDWFCKSGEVSFEILDNEQAVSKFENVLKNIKNYDFLLAYDPARKPCIKAVTKCRLSGVPYFVNNDGALIRKSNFIKGLIKRFIFGGAKLCFGSSKSSDEYFLMNGVKKESLRRHNFTSLNDEDILKERISNEEKKTLKTELDLNIDKIYVITVGQFIERKGFDLLLEAWNKLDGKNAELIIVGGGDDRPKYEAFIAENKLTNVTIIDFLAKEALYDYYKASDIFILPTREDVWGLVVNEAMACGLPVVSSDNCVAAQELIEQGENGFIYPVYDIDAMKDCLQKLVDDEKLRERIADNNISKIQGNTIENIGKKHIADIEEWFDNNKK